eukprot:CAMPEP_0117419614 /NCGR_PEP_ID=MMETSP0758-20121206/1136_1 /TAXON_ID=63605 /ORGANISM="Percolomonas cosmopolitus, Strain AE-1 (ATCC 50343)" /LENGTH=775 /DNA_ID=CAMNT_0005200775 /DNA_START=1032 /DNA_END=3356 /DNA_ORIENTATION=+
MTNSQNSTVICNKLLYFAKRAIDMDLRKKLIQQVTKLAEDFPPNNQWYFDTLNECFFIDAQFVSDEAIHTLLNVIAEGNGESEEDDEAFRRYAVNQFVEIMMTHNTLSDRHIQIIAWVLGEYGYLSESHSKNELIDMLQDLCERSLEMEGTRTWIFSALLKLVVQEGSVPSSLIELLHRYKFSHRVEVQQRCIEFLKVVERLSSSRATFQEVLPYDGSYDDIAVDSALSFLNHFVQQAQQSGQQGYIHEADRDTSIVDFQKPSLILQHRSQPEPVQNAYAGSRFNPHSENAYNPYSETTATHNNHTPPPKVEKQEIPQNTHGLDPSLLGNAKKVWFDSDEEDDDVDESSTPPAYNQSQTLNPVNSPYSDRGASSSYNPAASSSSSSSATWDSPSYNNHPLPKLPREEEYKAPKKETTELVGAMFGGMTNEAPMKKKKRSKPKSQKQQQPKSSMLDFEDFMNQPIQEQAPPPATHSVDDMFDFGSSQQPSHTSTDTSFDDMFATTTDTSQVSSAVEDDVFFSSISQTKNFAEHQASSNALNSTPCSIYKQLISDYGGSSPKVACVDAYLKVSSETFYAEDALVLTVTFETERGYELTNVTFSIQSPTKWVNQFRSEYPYYSSSNPTVVQLKKLQPGIPARVHIYYQLSGLGFGQSLIGTVNYSDNSKQSRHNTLNIKFSIFDVLRPKKATIAQFGPLWKKHSREKKVALSFAADQTPESIAHFLTSTCHFHRVQIRDTEIVCCAYLISLDLPCLLHAKLTNSKTASLTIRSKDTAL